MLGRNMRFLARLAIAWLEVTLPADAACRGSKAPPAEGPVDWGLIRPLGWG